MTQVPASPSVCVLRRSRGEKEKPSSVQVQSKVSSKVVENIRQLPPVLLMDEDCWHQGRECVCMLWGRNCFLGRHTTEGHSCHDTAIDILALGNCVNGLAELKHNSSSAITTLPAPLAWEIPETKQQGHASRRSHHLSTSRCVIFRQRSTSMTC